MGNRMSSCAGRASASSVGQGWQRRLTAWMERPLAWSSVRSLLRSSAAVLVAALVLPGTVLAVEDAARLVPSADGQWVQDRASGLIWARCVEGMSWDGRTCRGTAKLATHAEALALARTRSTAAGRLWRVPRVSELRQLSEGLALSREPADRLFPAAPAGWYWTSTAQVDSEVANPYNYRNIERGNAGLPQNRLDALHGWVAQPATGESLGGVSKRERLPVRLVRSATD